ncbi:MAG: HNH endonuclease [Clostridiales bacterium]|nr:HNH endonuclease [Clostridiales bacterium]
MLKKNRVTIPKNIADEVMFIHNNTCCVCREAYKATQIHHIDENPANNDINNLAVLCLECHNQTQITGGFGRHLNASQVIKYRNQWLEIVKERNHNLTLTTFPAEKSPSNCWEKIDYTNQCGIENAIAGLGLNQNSVISCPKLPIFNEAYINVNTLHFVSIIGESGSGKSLTAFQIAYEFYKNGYDIFLYIGGDPAELPSNSPALYIIDNAHLYQSLVNRLKTKVNKNVKLICVYTDSANVQERGIRITAKQAVDVLYDYYKTNAKLIIPVIKSINRRFGTDFGDISYANLIARARLQKSPYYFNYIIRGAADYIKDKISTYKEDEVSEILTIIAIHQILNADDYLSVEKINELISPQLLSDDFETKLVFNDKVLVRNKIGFKFSHIHTAINYLNCYIANSFDNQTFANRTFWYYFNNNSYSMQGFLWLVNNLPFGGVNYKTNRQNLGLFTTEEIETIYDKLQERKNETYFLGVIEKIEHYLKSKNINDNIDEYIEIINSCQVIDLPSVGGFLNMQINKGKDDDYFTLKKIHDNINYSRILKLFNAATSEDLIYFVRFFDRLSYNFNGWNKKVTKYLDIDGFTLKIKNISLDYLYSITSIAATFSSCDKNLIEIKDACINKILLYLNQNPFETWQQIDDHTFFQLWGYQSFFDRIVTKSLNDKIMRARFAESIDANILASQVSSNVLYHWQSISQLFEIIYRFDKNKYYQTTNKINLNKLAIQLRELWGTEQEFEFLDVLYHDSKAIKKLIILCEADIKEITPAILYFSVESAIYLHKKGKIFNFKYFRNDHILSLGLLKLVKRDKSLGIRLIVENKENLIKFIKGHIYGFEDSDIKLKKFIHKSLNEIKDDLYQSNLTTEELDTLLDLRNYNLAK